MTVDARGGVLEAVRPEEAGVYALPGRDWIHLMGPENSASRALTVGLSIFPAGSSPPGHVHDLQEEVVFVISGEGKLVAPTGTVELRPGTCVHVPPGLFHATVSDGPEPLRLLCSFSPPVAPGSYEETAS